MYTPMPFYPLPEDLREQQSTYLSYELVKPIVETKLTQMGISFTEPIDSEGWQCSSYNYIMPTLTWQPVVRPVVVAIQFQIMIYTLNNNIVLVPQYVEGSEYAFNIVSCLILEEFRPDWQHNEIISWYM